jgi:hypothetical protein
MIRAGFKELEDIYVNTGIKASIINRQNHGRVYKILVLSQGCFL